VLQTVAEMEEVSKRVFPDWYEPKPLVLPHIIPAFKSKPECIGFRKVQSDSSMTRDPFCLRNRQMKWLGSQEAQVQVPSTNADLTKQAKVRMK